MGKCGGSGLHSNPHWLLPDLSFMSRPPDPEHQNMEPMICPSYMTMNPYPYMVPTSNSLPGFAMAASPQLGMVEPDSWYSCHNSLHPSTPNSFLDERYSAIPLDLHYNKPDISTPNPAAQTSQKKFLVFDQSGNRRSLIFSTTSSPLKFPISTNQRQCGVEITSGGPMNRSMPIRNNCLEQEVIWENGLNETEASGENGSEMHEDTEDLEALLSSDYEEEEVASTGHSPSDMMGCEREEQDDDEAASFAPSKRRRFEENNRVEEESEYATHLMDTASSVKHHGCWDNYHEAESSCKKSSNHLDFERESFAKRSRREKIKKTVGILRSIIPGGKGKKDATLVLDETIRYLKSLQLKAKSLGVH